MRSAWFEAHVFPRFGTAILDNDINFAAGVDRFGSARLIFRCDAVRVVTFPHVYVASTGNNTTGVVSFNDATTAANTCLTLGGA